MPAGKSRNTVGLAVGPAVGLNAAQRLSAHKEPFFFVFSLSIVCLLLSHTSFAAEPAPPAGNETAESARAPKAGPGQETSSRKQAENDAADDKSNAPPKSPASSADKGPSPQRFVPSEQVRADFDVSFPIDI